MNSQSAQKRERKALEIPAKSLRDAQDTLIQSTLRTNISARQAPASR